MRVISGERRGMNLFSPQGEDIRPTEDRVKEAVFNTIFQVKPRAQVLDLFAGSGGIGIEFLSRGAGFCVFSEMNPRHSRTVRENLEKTRYSDRAQILTGDFRRNLQNMQRRGYEFDYIYIDPPYEELAYYRLALEAVLDLDLLKEDGLVIVESKKPLDFSYVDQLEVHKHKTYGKKKNLYYLRAQDD